MFEWRSEYSVQMPDIDAQHQRLFVLAAELHRALVEGKPKPALERMLTSLVDHANLHFAYEERMMRKHLYPEADAHALGHDQLRARMLDLQQGFHIAEKTPSFEVLLFMKNWLEHHITGSDHQYSVFIRSRRAA